MQERLQKIIATAGVTSRRKAEEMIVQGRVSVNGHVIRELGSKADADRDKILVDGKPLPRSHGHLVVLLNKPTGVVSTLHDPQGRPTVVKLLEGVKERVYPVGRLDYNSSGLLLLTNDGELTNFLTSRASRMPRTYHVKLEGQPSVKDLARLERGIVLDGRPTEPCRIRMISEREKPWYEITLVEGRYHQVRRMFERAGQRVVKLKRVRFAFLTDRSLAPGRFRYLSTSEIDRLKHWKTEAGRER
ncbi:MAG: rRNA pseudouridine synthase [Acidobacteria bacterium]|nr:MAG: rRNA pseudouridine synthase [Acidobacteriota bacterium]